MAPAPPPFRRGRRRAIALLLAGSFPSLGTAQSSVAAPELCALVADDGTATEQIIGALRRRHSSLIVSHEPATLIQRRGPAIYLAIGPAALRNALQASMPGPLITLFTSSQEYERIVAGARGRSITAIFAETSPASQMMLASRLYGRRITVAVLLTDGTASLEPVLRTSANAADISLTIGRVAEGENPVRALVRAAPFDVLLAIPDRAVITPTNVRTLLESTYRRGQGAIGFSAALVQAGMLGAAFASIDDTLAHLDELLENLQSTSRLPEPQYPRYWRVAINDSVARSLGLHVDDADRALGVRPPRRPS